MLLPQQDRTFTILTGGDIAIAQGRVENGVAMVPVRAVRGVRWAIPYSGMEWMRRSALTGREAPQRISGWERTSTAGDGGGSTGAGGGLLRSGWRELGAGRGIHAAGSLRTGADREVSCT